MGIKGIDRTRHPLRPQHLPSDFHEFVAPAGYKNTWVSRDGRAIGPFYRPLKQVVDKYGYIQVTVDRNGKGRVTSKMHRLVAIAFCPNPDRKPHVNHIDGNKKNNNYNNLEWVTPAENSQHAWKTGLLSVDKIGYPRGEGHYNHKVDSQRVRAMSAAGMNNTQIARTLGISRPHVSNIVNMKTRKTG